MSGTGGANNPGGAHLMICLVSPTPEGDAIVVPIVTRHYYSDTSCTLTMGDHPFIKHDSCAAYDHIRRVSLGAVKTDIESGSIKLQAPVDPAILVRLQVGLVTSDETAPWAFNAAYGTRLTAHLKHKGHM